MVERTRFQFRVRDAEFVRGTDRDCGSDLLHLRFCHAQSQPAKVGRLLAREGARRGSFRFGLRPRRIRFAEHLRGIDFQTSARRIVIGNRLIVLESRR